ncbi:unnamed protein product [Gordionus sp. m RMFG-2023]
MYYADVITIALDELSNQIYHAINNLMTKLIVDEQKKEFRYLIFLGRLFVTLIQNFNEIVISKERSDKTPIITFNKFVHVRCLNLCMQLHSRLIKIIGPSIQQNDVSNLHYSNEIQQNIISPIMVVMMNQSSILIDLIKSHYNEDIKPHIIHATINTDLSAKTKNTELNIKFESFLVFLNDITLVPLENNPKDVALANLPSILFEILGQFEIYLETRSLPDDSLSAVKERVLDLLQNFAVASFMTDHNNHHDLLTFLYSKLVKMIDFDAENKNIVAIERISDLSSRIQLIIKWLFLVFKQLLGTDLEHEQRNTNQVSNIKIFLVNLIKLSHIATFRSLNIIPTKGARSDNVSITRTAIDSLLYAISLEVDDEIKDHLLEEYEMSGHLFQLLSKFSIKGFSDGFKTKNYYETVSGLAEKAIQRYIDLHESQKRFYKRITINNGELFTLATIFESLSNIMSEETTSTNARMNNGVVHLQVMANFLSHPEFMQKFTTLFLYIIELYDVSFETGYDGIPQNGAIDCNALLNLIIDAWVKTSNQIHKHVSQNVPPSDGGNRYLKQIKNCWNILRDRDDAALSSKSNSRAKCTIMKSVPNNVVTADKTMNHNKERFDQDDGAVSNYMIDECSDFSLGI